ncbi:MULTISPECIES: 3'-5' exonuclease [Arthrobacter]|uniref:3'-5' exonuclease n=2 Tax=Arthrobacter TaxID=1663 RepID=A0ABU9KHR4_9MICC|nr:3'-5' exonuclease [Arthrobacter sp. YJM1]MDP5226558.1 3'-5' exonuclease [Arthrobacter sp. YJM1]
MNNIASLASVPASGLDFTAIDFETANSDRGSVCAVGLAKVIGGAVVDTTSWLIAPPEPVRWFDSFNTAIHGIRAVDVATAPGWEESAEQIASYVGGDHLVAHNAAFDASVIRKAGEHTGHPFPGREVYCSFRLAQRLLDLPKYKLPIVAAELGVSGFRHHDAGDDARVCAEIVIALAGRHGATAVEGLWERPTSAVGDMYPLPRKTRQPRVTGEA